jgi:hypothetical protein
MCEGPNELAIVNILLEHNCFSFSRDDLVTLVPFHARQIDKSTAIQLALNMYTGAIRILRIGDTLNDKLRIPTKYKDRIVSVEKFCTKPELEMLFIIAENLCLEFDKVKSSLSPKLFCKSNVSLGRKKYDNSTQFYIDYFSSNPEKLVWCINEYKRTHKKHLKDEYYLADLLK